MLRSRCRAGPLGHCGGHVRQGDVRTALFLVALNGLLRLYLAGERMKERVGQVGQGLWVLAALGWVWVARWAVAVAERAWVGLWHVLWWWMWG